MEVCRANVERSHLVNARVASLGRAEGPERGSARKTLCRASFDGVGSFHFRAHLGDPEVEVMWINERLAQGSLVSSRCRVDEALLVVAP